MFHMVGYLSSEVKEAAERVRTAMRNAGYIMPAKKIVINLSPACVRKKGSVFDLPIAVAVLGAMGIFPEKAVEDILLLPVPEYHYNLCPILPFHEPLPGQVSPSEAYTHPSAICIPPPESLPQKSVFPAPAFPHPHLTSESHST